ncbi:MAG: filamentous hemagglutinin N-terminal domain-containing protein [Vulcanimicrobiota bacterium]
MIRKRATLLAGLLALGGRAWGLPEGGQVQAGSVQTQAAGTTMTIQQMSDRAIINWNGFSIGANELVNVLQPNQAAILLNRVVGQDPSQIFGQLNANGNIWLLNPNGILFGAGAQINVGGLLASTLNLSDRDFLAGRYNFSQAPDKPLASVVNQGELHIAPNGYLIMAAPLVSNQGLIVANLGKVALLAGDQMSISLDSQGLINYRLAQAGPSAGPVLLSPEMVSDVLRSVVQRGEIAEASIITQSDGKIFLGSGSGVAIQAGTIQAPSLVVDSQRETLVRTDSVTSITNGGEARLLSQGLTWSQPGSLIQAPNANVEVSGHRLAASGQVELGQSGRLLLDPDFLTIVSGAGNLDQNPILPGDGAPISTVGAVFLEGIGGGTIDLQAQDTITVATSLTLQANVSLHLQAVTGDIVFADVNHVLTTSGSGGFDFQAGRDILLGQLQTDPGGSVLLNAGQDVLSAGSLLIAQSNISSGSLQAMVGRNFNLTTTGAGGSLDVTQLSAGNVTLASNGPVDVQNVVATEGIKLSSLGGGDINLHGTLQAGTSIVVGSTGSLTADVSQNAISAPDVILFATGNVVASLFGEPQTIPELVSSTNLAIQAGGALQGLWNFNSPHFAIQTGAGSVDLGLNGDREIVNFGGVDGLRVLSANPSTYAGVNVFGGGLQISAPVVAHTIYLQADGNIGQGPGVTLSTDQLYLTGGANSDVTVAALTAATVGVDASSNNNLSVTSGNSTDLTFLDSSSGDARINVSGDLNLQTYISAPGVMSVNVTGNLNNNQGGEGGALAYGGQLVLRAASFTGDPIETSVDTLAVNSGSGFSSFQFGHLQIGTVDGVNGINATGNADVTVFDIDGSNGLTVQAPITAQNVSLSVDGNLVINSPLGPINGTTGVELSSTNLLMTDASVVSPNVVTSISGNTLGSGVNNIRSDQLTASTGGLMSLSGGPLNLPSQTVSLQADADLSYFSSGNLTVSSAGSSSGEVFFGVQGDLTALNPITGFDLVTISATGGLTASTVLAQSPRLELMVGDQTSQLRIQTGLLAATSAGNLNLVQSGPLTIGDINSTSGVTAASSLNITSESGGLTLASPLQASSVHLLVNGALDTPAVGTVIFASDLALSIGSQVGGPLQVATQTLSADSLDSLDLSVTSPLLTFTGGSIANNFNLVSNNDIQVAGLTSAANVSLQSTSGDIALLVPGPQASLFASQNASVIASSGNITMLDLGVTAPNATIQSAGNIIGNPVNLPNVLANQLNIDTTGGNTSLSVDRYIFGPPSTAALNVTSSGNVSLAGNFGNLTVQQLVSTGGDIRLSAPNNIQVDTTIQSPGLISVLAGGDLVNTAGLMFASGQLAVRAHGVSGLPLQTNVGQLAGLFQSDVEIIQSAPLTIGLVDALSGLQSSGNLLLTLGGNTQINQPVQAQNVTVNMGPGAGLTVNSPAPGISGSTGVEINMAGGILSLTGNAVSSPQAVLSVNATNGSGAGNLLADQLTVTSNGNFSASGGAFSLPSQTLDIIASGEISYTSGNSTVVSQLTSTAGNVNLNVNGDLSTFSPITASDLVNVSLTGTASSGGLFSQSSRLQLDAGDVSAPLTIQTGLLAARSQNNLNLVQSVGDLTVGNVVTLDGLAAVKNLDLVVTNNLQLDSPITAQTVNLQVGGNLVNTQSARAITANSLTLQMGSQTGAPITLDTRSLNVQSGANATLDATGTLNVVGGNVVNNLTLTGNSATQVTGPVHAGNIALSLSSGNLDLQSPTTALQADGLLNLQVSSGNLTMTGPSASGQTVSMNVSNDITGSGAAPNVRADNLNLNSTAGAANFTLGSLNLPEVAVLGGTAGNLILSSGNNTAVLGLFSSSADILLDVSGNARLNGTIQSPGAMTVNVSGVLTNQMAGPAVFGDRLALTVGDLNGNPLRTSVNTLTADSGGNLSLAQSIPLTIGTPDGKGIHAVNNATLALSGETLITQPVSAQNVSIQMNGANLTVNSPAPGVNGSSTVDITTTGGNLTLVGSAISTPNATLSLGGDLLGSGGLILADQLKIVASGTINGRGGALLAPTQTVDLSSAGNLSYTANNSTIVNSTSSSAGNVDLNVTGNLNVLNPISSPDLVNVTVSGSPGASGVFNSSPRLALNVGDNTSPLTINAGLLAATSANNINLVQVAPLTVGTIGTLAGVQAGNALNLTTGDLRLDSPVTGQAVNLHVGGVLTSNQTIPSVTGGSLFVDLVQDSANPITVDVRGLSGRSDGNLTVSSTGTLDVVSSNVTNNFILTGNADTRVLSPVQAANVSIDLSAGELRLASRSGAALQASNNVSLQVQAGNLTLVGPEVAAPNVQMSASGNITGTLGSPQVLADSLIANSSGGELAFTFAPFSLPQTTASLSAAGNMAVASAGSVNLQQANTLTGDVLLDVTGNLQLNGALQSPGVMSVNVTGTLVNNVAGPAAIGNQLALRIGDYSGTPLQTQVNTLAASTAGNLALSQSTPLTVGSVDALNGISAVGDVLLVLSGETQINQAVTGQNVTVQMTGANLTISSPGLSGTTGVEVDTLGGNLTLNGTAISAPIVALGLSNDFAGATGGILADQLIVSSGGNFSGQGATFSQPTQTVTLSSAGNLSYVSPGSLTVNSANSSGGNVSLDVTGNLNVLSPITAVDLVSVTVTGSPTAAGLFAQAPRLALRTGDVSSPLNVNVGTLAASSSGNLSLHQDSPLTIGTIGSLVGASAQNTLTLNTSSNLQLDAPLTAQSVVLQVGGQLNNNLPGSPAVLANSLTLTENSQGANPLTLDVRNLNAQSNDSLSVSGQGALNVQSATAPNNITLGGTSETLVSGPVQASNITVNQSSGNLTLNSPTPALQGSQTVSVQLANGALTMSGPSISAPSVNLQTSGNISGTGTAPTVRANTLTVNSTGGSAALSYDPLSLPQTTVTASAFGNLALTSASSTFLEQASSSSGDVRVDVTGNLRLDGPVQSPGVMSVNVTGTMTNNVTGPAAVGNQLALRVGNFSGTPLQTQVNTLAASTAGNLALSQSTPLTVGSVDALNGISAVGDVLLVLSGETQINQAVTGQNVTVQMTGANLTINSPGLSGTTGVEVDTLGGNLTLNGTAISAPIVALGLSNDFAGATGGILADQLIVSSGGNFSGQGATFSQPTQTVTLSSAGNLSYVSPGSLTVNSANSSGGNVSLDVTGNLNVLSPITAADLVSVTVTGSPTAAGLFAQAPRLALRTGDVSSPLNVNVGTLAASSSGNLNLHQDSPLTIGTIGSLVGASAQNTLTLNTSSNLQLDAPLTAQSVVLQVGGQLNNNLPGSPAVLANSLSLTENSQGANPLTINARSITGQSSGNMSLVATGTLDVQGLSVANNLSLNGDSNTQLSAPVQAGNATISLSNGDLTLQSASQPTLVAGDTANVQVSKGNLNLSGQAIQAPQVQLNVGGNVQGSGASPNIQTDQLNYQSATGNFDASLDRLTQPATTVSAATTGNVSFSSPHDLNVAASGNNLNISTPGNLTATGTLLGTGAVTLQVGNTLSSSGRGPLVSAPSLNLQAGNTGRLTLDVDAISAVGTTLSFVFDRPNAQVQSIQGSDVTLSATGNLLVSGPVSATTLSLSSLGNMTLGASSVTATTAVLTVGGNLTGSGQTDMQVQNLRLDVSGSVGSNGHPLILGGSTNLAGHIGADAYLQSESGLTISTVAGATGFSAGAPPVVPVKGIPFGPSVQMAVNQGNLQLNQNLTVANGTVFLLAPNGSIQGNGIVLTQDLGFFAGQSVNLFTDVNALAGVGQAVTVTEVDQFTVDGLTFAQIGDFTGVTGTVVAITAQNGNINLVDTSLLGMPGVTATVSASFNAQHGSIFGGPNGVNVQSPVNVFQASGSVGTPGAPILIPRDSDFNSSNPFFVQVYPPLPPSPVLEVIIPAGDLSEALAATGNVTLSDATSLGVTVGTLPTITLRALGSRDDPAALVQISWNIPGEDGGGGTQTFRRPYLLDFSLEQLLSQPVNSRFLSLTLEELLNQPVISPMLEKTLEELLQEDLSGD